VLELNRYQDSFDFTHLDQLFVHNTGYIRILTQVIYASVFIQTRPLYIMSLQMPVIKYLISQFMDVLLYLEFVPEFLNRSATPFSDMLENRADPPRKNFHTPRLDFRTMPNQNLIFSITLYK